MPKFFLLLLIASGCFAQDCMHKNLSDNFDFAVTVERLESRDQFLDTCRVKIDIMKKDGLIIHEIQFVSEFMLSETFVTCDAVRSYVTGVNKDSFAPDNDYGDLIVADFNFDGLDDLAVKREEGGNGGPLYYFYVQDKEGDFGMDKFLTQEMVFFPIEINTAKKRLVTLIHANAYQMAETIYVLKGKKNWKQVSHRLVP